MITFVIRISLSYYFTSTGIPSPDLSFQRGVRYTYRYSTTITTTLHGSNAGRNGLALDCVVDIDVVSKCHLMMQVSFIKIVNKHCKGSKIQCFHAHVCPTDQESTDKASFPSEGALCAAPKKPEVIRRLFRAIWCFYNKSK